MCTAPLLIRNRSKLLNLDAYQTHYRCACGHCTECRQQRQRDLSYRAGREYEALSDGDGYAFFNTLTFNSKFLPKYTYEDEQGIKQSIGTFDSHYIDLFFKHLRDRLDKHDVKFRYLITAEQGEKFLRPHYHFILYLDKYIHPNTLKVYIAQSWTLPRVDADGNQVVVYDKRSHLPHPVMDSLGWIDSRPASECVVRKEGGAIRYVSNYSAKTLASLVAIQPIVDRLVNRVRDQYKQGLISRKKMLYDISCIRRILPRTRTSVDFGMYGVDYHEEITTDNMKIDFKKVYHPDWILDHQTVVHSSVHGFYEASIPQYYVRKLLYKPDKVVNPSTGEEFTHYFPLPEYVDYKLSRVNQSIDASMEHLRLMVNTLREHGVSSYCSDDLSSHNIEADFQRHYKDLPSVLFYRLYQKFHVGSRLCVEYFRDLINHKDFTEVGYNGRLDCSSGHLDPRHKDADDFVDQIFDLYGEIQEKNNLKKQARKILKSLDEYTGAWIRSPLVDFYHQSLNTYAYAI